MGSGFVKDLGFWYRRRWGGKGIVGRGASVEGRGGVCVRVIVDVNVGRS